MVEKAATIWADGPSSAPDQPSKPLIREWGTWLEGFISAIGENVGTIFETKAQMDAALAYDANTMAWVAGDSAVANNGVYRKTGASGSGSWTRVADLPYSYVTVVDDGTSTANAMSMETETTVPTGRGTMIAIKVPLTNTSSTVTISFNGSTAIPVKTASGGLPPVGTLIQNMVCLGFVNDVDSVFQLMTDVASAAIQTAAAASASAASTSATNAATSATLAQDWATKAEDVPVTGSLYSAFHWAQKAMASGVGSIANVIHGATSKSAPTALDEFAIADSAASWGLKKVTAESVMSGPQGYIYGLAMTTNATDAANDIDFAAGVATSDTAPYYRMTASAMTKRLDATFTVGTGNGMLDTGTVANSTYYLFEIQRSDTLVVDFLASLSSTAPTMPSGYDRKRLIGSLVRSGGVNGVPVTTGVSSGRKLISSTEIASAVSAIDLTAFDSSKYMGYEIYLSEVTLSTSTYILGYTSGNGGTSWDNATNSYDTTGMLRVTATWNGSGGLGTSMFMTAQGADQPSATSGYASVSGKLEIISPEKLQPTKVKIDLEYFRSLDTRLSEFDATAARLSNTAVNGFRLTPASGNFTSGTVYFFGIPKV